jgi:hypothetical protein
MDRHAEVLAPQIPQGDIDRADRLDISALTAEIACERIKLFPDFYRLIGAPVKEQRRQHIVDA